MADCTAERRAEGWVVSRLILGNPCETAIPMSDGEFSDSYMVIPDDGATDYDGMPVMSGQIYEDVAGRRYVAVVADGCEAFDQWQTLSHISGRTLTRGTIQQMQHAVRGFSGRYSGD